MRVAECVRVCSNARGAPARVRAALQHAPRQHQRTREYPRRRRLREVTLNTTAGTEIDLDTRRALLGATLNRSLVRYPDTTLQLH